MDIDKLKNVPSNLSSLKIKLDKLDIDKLLPIPDGLSKLKDVVNNDVAKKDVDNPKIKIDDDKIRDITNLTTNTTLDAKISKVKDELPGIINLATASALNAKINNVKEKIPSTTNLATTTALTAVENKVSNVSNLVKKNLL